MPRDVREFRGEGRTTGSAWTTTAVVAAVALLLRAWHLAEFARLPWFSVLQMDGKFHAEWARRLVENHWSDPQVFFRAPIYPYFLAVLRLLTGEVLWSARIVQIGLGVATVALVHRLAVRLLPGRWSTAAGLLAALAWVPIHYETELLLEPLVTFLTTLALFLAVRAEGRPRPFALIVWGGLAGLATATRPNALVLLPLLMGYAAALLVSSRATPVAGNAGSAKRVARRRPTPRADWEAWARALPGTAGLVLAGFALPVLPIWIHNARQGDPATILAWQGGINLYIGNNPASNGWSAVAPDMRTDWQGGFDDAIRIAQERSGGRTLLPSRISAYWAGEARRFWERTPGQALGLTLTKALLFWGNTEIKNNEDPRFMRQTMASLRWLPVSFGLLAPLALIGIVLAMRAGPRFVLLALFVIGWFVSIVPFFICARYRLPITPLLPLFALLAIRDGARWWRLRRWRVLGPTAVIGLALYPILFVPRAGVEKGGVYQAWSNLGDAYSELQEWDPAVAAYRRSLALDPGYVACWNNLGLALEKLGRLEEAEGAYRQGLAGAPGHPTLRRNLGIVLEKRGKPDQASEVYRALLRDQPAAWDVALSLAGILNAQARPDEAIAVCRSALEAAPTATPLRVRLVALLRSLGRTQEAETLLRDGLRVAPGDPDLRRLAAGGRPVPPGESGN